MSVNLLQHQIERFGMVTVMDVILFDIKEDKPVLLLDTLKISSIDVESSEKEIKGGLYADRLAAYDYGREANVTFQDALLSFESMKHLWGADVERVSGNFKITTHQVYRGVLPAAGSGDDFTITLPYEPKQIDLVSVAGEALESPAGYTLAEKTLTILEGKAGDEVLVMYRAELDEAATAGNDWEPVQARLASNKFPKTVKLVGKTFIIHEATGEKLEAEIEFPKLKLNANFSLGLEAEGDASVFDFGGLALADGVNKDLIIIKGIGAYED